MTVKEVEDEVRSVFFKAMRGRATSHLYSFNQLVPVAEPSQFFLSSSFSLTAQQVAKLGPNSKQSIYILAKDKLAVDLEVSVNCLSNH